MDSFLENSDMSPSDSLSASLMALGSHFCPPAYVFLKSLEDLGFEQWVTVKGESVIRERKEVLLTNLCSPHPCFLPPPFPHLLNSSSPLIFHSAFLVSHPICALRLEIHLVLYGGRELANTQTSKLNILPCFTIVLGQGSNFVGL